MKAKIIKILSKDYTILLEDQSTHLAILKGKMRKDVKPICGDYVNYEISDDKYVISEVLPRDNFMYRPRLANIDQAIIMMSFKDPDFSYELVNRLIYLIEYSNIKPVIFVSKSDLASTQELDEIINYYRDMNYEIHASSMHDEMDNIKTIIDNKISVLCGQSGVGKSSLLNKLIPDLNLKTDEISKALGRGKHTTRHVELYKVYDGYIADTPGFSSLDLSHIDLDYLPNHISAFTPYLTKCKFHDCKHINEPGCKIKEAVENGFIKETFYNVYKEIYDFISSGNLKANRHRTLK